MHARTKISRVRILAVDGVMFDQTMSRGSGAGYVVSSEGFGACETCTAICYEAISIIGEEAKDMSYRARHLFECHERRLRSLKLPTPPPFLHKFVCFHKPLFQIL